jgi:hypothetical protein
MRNTAKPTQVFSDELYEFLDYRKSRQKRWKSWFSGDVVNKAQNTTRAGKARYYRGFDK